MNRTPPSLSVVTLYDWKVDNLPPLNNELPSLMIVPRQEGKERLMRAVENICEKVILTKDLGGSANTKYVTSAVCD